MKFFNTEGPIQADIHYHIPSLKRWNLSEILTLIDRRKYFVLHAPRQTGKTTCLLALMDYLNARGHYTALYINVEAAQAAREDVSRGIHAIASEFSSRLRSHLNDGSCDAVWKPMLEQHGAERGLAELLMYWAKQSQRPVVLLIDEIDALIGDSLISVLRQIRSGYDKRPTLFPQSILLCGVRDVRDYRLHSATDKAVITGGSAFNIKAKSLRLGNFSLNEITQLYRQHTIETGQPFDEAIFALVYHYTHGQPWLVNALAYELCFEICTGQDRRQPITCDMAAQARENLILRRDTHLDQLIDKLREERVRRVIEPVLAGDDATGELRPDDVQYAIDLGLIRQERNGAIDIANEIYREVIPRELSWTMQSGITQQTAWYVESDGTLNMSKLLQAFQEFFREHSEHWIERFDYKEAGPHLLLQAFLQRIVNSGGRVEREYGLGRKRTDLLVLWPHSAGVQKVVLELKILRKSLEQTMNQGLGQTFEYMDRTAAESGHLVIFDRSQGTTWEEKLFWQQREYRGKTISIWGC